MTANEGADLRAATLTLLVGGTGALVFAAIGFPAPFLTGPAVAVTLASVAGLNTQIPALLRDACFLIIGLNIGAGVTPAVMDTALQWPQSFVILIVALSIGMWLSRRVLEAHFGFNPREAFLAAAPGHLSYVLSLSVDLRADVARIALVQSIRVLLLTLVVPVLLMLWGVKGDAPLEASLVMRPLHLVAVAGVAMATGLLFRRLQAPAALLLAAMLVSGLGHLSALTPGLPPAWLTLGAFVVLGTLIGTRFRGQGTSDLRANAVAGVAMTLIACAVASAGAMLTARWLDLPPELLLIAFVPGGVETMAAMAVQIEVDATFVAAHHIMRLIFLSFAIPFLMPDPSK